jgi:hypothetical protein
MNFQMPRMSRWKDVLVHLAVWSMLLWVPSAIYSFFPKPEFNTLLKSRYPNEFALVAGGRDQFSGSTTYSHRSYWLIPSALQVPRFIRVSQWCSEPPKVVDQGGGPFLLTFAIFLGFNVYYFQRRWRAQSADA